MKKENTKSPKAKASQREEDRWIDVRNDGLMIEMIARPKPQEPRDESVWTKTPYEKKMLRKVKHTSKHKDMHFHTTPVTIKWLRCKLIINLKKNKYFNKPTYSVECWQHEIPYILSKYKILNKKTGDSINIVKSYSWNGQTYNPKSLPFWR